MLVSAETKRRLSSHKRTLPTYIVHFLCNTKTRKQTSTAVIKTLSASEGFFNKNCAMSAEKYQSRWIIFFCRVGLMFSWPNKWEHASFGRNKTSVELAQKNLADLHCSFFMHHQNKKTSSAVKKNIICRRAFLNKNCATSAEKYQSRLFHDRCRLLSFQFNPWTKFAWCRLGNVRSASSDDASFLDPDRSSFLADVDFHFFLINIGE